ERIVTPRKQLPLDPCPVLEPVDVAEQRRPVQYLALDHDIHTMAVRTERRHGVGQLRSEEHTSELQSQSNLVCRLLLEKKKLAERGVGRRRLLQSSACRRCGSSNIHHRRARLAIRAGGSALKGLLTAASGGVDRTDHPD